MKDITKHDLYAHTDECFDIKREQSLLFSMTGSTFNSLSTDTARRHFLDEVFTYGCAYGPEGKALQDKEMVRKHTKAMRPIFSKQQIFMQYHRLAASLVAANYIKFN